MAHQLFQILAAAMVTAVLLVLAIAQLPVIGQATGIRGGREELRLLRPATGTDPLFLCMLLTAWRYSSKCKQL